MRPPRFRLACLAPALLLLAACGDDATGPTPATLEGIYPLVTLAGQPLPYVTDQQGEISVQVLGGKVTLWADGTFRDEIQIMLGNGGEESIIRQEANGTFTVNANVVRFTPTTTTKVEPYAMTLAGSTLTQNAEGLIWFYRKQ